MGRAWLTDREAARIRSRPPCARRVTGRAPAPPRHRAVLPRSLAKRAPRSVMVRTPAPATALLARRPEARAPAPRVGPAPGSRTKPRLPRESGPLRGSPGRRAAGSKAPCPGQDVARRRPHGRPCGGRPSPCPRALGGPIGDGPTHAPEPRHRRCLDRPRSRRPRAPRPTAPFRTPDFTPQRQPRARDRDAARPGDWRQLQNGAPPPQERVRAARPTDRPGAAGLRRAESSSWPTRCSSTPPTRRRPGS